MLLRHASANIKGFSHDEDHQKPLDDHGKSDNKNLSIWLKKKKIEIDLVVSSNATRALETADLVFSDLNVKVEKNAELYLCGYEEIYSIIKSLNNDVNNLVIVGHEPSISVSMKLLVGKMRPDLKKILDIPYPTCAMAFIYFNKISWKDLEERDGILEALLTPKTIGLK